MADSNKTRPVVGLSAQLNRLAGDLREQGVAPARDLWPDIDRQISAAERRQLRTPVRWAQPRWQLWATAAVVALALFGGWLGLERPGVMTAVEAPVAVVAANQAGPANLAVVDQALNEVNVALADDPNNRSLIGLSLMLQQSRGRLLRQNLESPLSGS